MTDKEEKFKLEVIASLKKIINDLETEKIIPWEYTFENVLGRTYDDFGYSSWGDVRVRKIILEFVIKSW